MIPTTTLRMPGRINEVDVCLNMKGIPAYGEDVCAGHIEGRVEDREPPPKRLCANAAGGEQP